MIYQLAFRRYALPFAQPVRTAHGPWSVREGLLVQLTTADARRAWGEVAVLPWFGTETVDEAADALTALGEYITAERLAELPARLGCLHSALAAAQAQLAEPTSPPLPPGHWPVAALLPAGEAALARARERAAQGFRTFKWKVGVGALADELAILDDVLAELPSGSALRLDANGAWTRAQAERWLTVAADCPVEWIEQPIARDARGATDVLLGLAGDYPTPIALDESLVGQDDIEHWLALSWPGLYVLKTSLLKDASSVLARLQAARAEVVFSSALETAVGARAALRLALSHTPTQPRRALGFGVWPLFQDRRWDGPWATPFWGMQEVAASDEEALWNALS